MSVRRQLLLALAPIAVALIASGVASIAAVSRLGRVTDLLLRENYRSILAAQRMKDAAARMENAVVLHVAGWKHDARDRVREERQRFDSELRTQELTVYEPEERGPTESLREQWPDLDAAIEAVLRASDPATARDLYWSRLTPALRAIRTSAQDLIRANQVGMVRKNEVAKASAARIGVIMFAAIALSGGAALAVSGLLLRRVSHRVERLISAVERVDAGDFTTRVDLPGNDEIAVLAARFDDLAAHLDDFRRSSAGELLQAQRSTQATIDSIPDPVVVFGARGYVLAVNAAACRLLEVPAPVHARDPLASAPPAIRAPLEKARDDVLSGAAMPPASAGEALRVSTPLGEREYLPRATPVLAGSGEVVGATVVLQDVSALRQLDDLRNELVATVAHELRTPLTSLRMAVDLTLERAVALQPRERQLLAAAQASCARLKATVDDLLSLARMQGGQLELRRRPVPVARLVATAMGQAQAQAREDGVQVVARIPEEVGGASVDVDADRVQLAFANLLANAVRHSPAREEVRVCARAAGSEVEISVEDRGAGIPAEHRAHVFDKFYRVPGSPPDGAGLGLAIARGIVAAHGGRIGVEPGAGGGSRFWFTLPMAVAPAA